MRIKISAKSIGVVYAMLTDENPVTAKRFYDALPIEGKANLWGDEIYFSVPIEVVKENGRIVVKEGEIAIWVENPSFCVFFGITPVSSENEIRAFSDVNVIGSISGDPMAFRSVKRGEIIKIEKANG